MTASINASTSSGVIVTSDTSGSLALQTASTTAVTIDTSQNVGVGTASPAYKLDVNGTANLRSTDTAVYVRWDNSKLLTMQTNESGAIAAEGMKFTVNGRTQYGVINSFGGALRLVAADAGSNANTVFSRYDGTTLTESMRIDSSGNLLIGKTSATSGAQGLDVQLAGTAGNQIGFSSQGNSNGQTIYTNTSTGNWRLTFAFGGTNIGTYGVIQFDNSGNAYKASGAGSWLATSDIRIKTNIAPVTDGLSRILQLKPSTFDYKQPKAHQGKVHDKGFIADEYELVYPNSVIDSELVHDLDKQYTDDDKTLKAMSFNAEFYADLVSSIKELSAQVTELKAEVQGLKGA